MPTIPYEYVLITVAWAALFVGMFLRDYTLKMLTAIFILVLGIVIIADGINGIVNFTTEVFGILHLGIAFYVLVTSNKF
jgi:hypothetical protein|tara:strand:+ start:624 stop:860 length:237 start_codon:yes stop_codon:yes gene_type:complete